MKDIGKQSDNPSGWLKILTVNLLLAAIILGSLELLATKFYPQFSNAYFTESVTRGHPVHLHSKWAHRVGAGQVDENLVRVNDDYRALFVGDSVTYGYGVPYDGTYHRTAANILADRNCGVVVHGLGRLHSNLDTLMESDQQFILEGFGADLVVYQFNINDVVLSHAPKKRHADELTLKERFEKFRISYLNRSTFLKVVQAKAMQHYQQGRSARLADIVPYSPAANEANYQLAWERFADSLMKAKQELGRRGIDFVVLSIPESYRISELDIDNDFKLDTAGITAWPDDKVSDIAVDMGIQVWDGKTALRQFRQQNPDVKLYFPNDANHPTIVGHKVIGNFVAEKLKELDDLCGG